MQELEQEMTTGKKLSRDKVANIELADLQMLPEQRQRRRKEIIGPESDPQSGAGQIKQVSIQSIDEVCP